MGERYALLIGISQYDNCKPLPEVEHNIIALRSLLVDPEIGKYKKGNVTCILTKNNEWDNSENFTLNGDLKTVTRKISELFEKKQKDDTLLLYFAGHGETIGGKGYLYVSDTTERDTLSMISQPSIETLFDENTSRRVVIIIDACYSGTWAMGSDIEITKEKSKPSEGYFVITSSGLERSYTKDKLNEGSEFTVFTHFLIQGLQTGEADSPEDYIIDFDDIFQYVAKKMKTARQTPRSKKTRNVQGDDQVAIAYNHKLTAYEKEPLWFEDDKLSFQEVAKEINDLGENKARLPIDILKSLYKIRNSGLRNVPHSFDVDRRIKVLSEQVFEELRNQSPHDFLDLQWLIATRSRSFLERMHFSRYLVTNRLFNLFLSDKHGYTNPDWWIEGTLSSTISQQRRQLRRLQKQGDKHPRVNVSFIEALIFCKWMQYVSGLNVDLPNLWERQGVAQKVLTTEKDENGEIKKYFYCKYPWGDKFLPHHKRWCNFRGSYRNGTSPVDFFDDFYAELGGDFSPFGLSDLCGNAWEWCYGDRHSGEDVVITGGSWRSRAKKLKVEHYEQCDLNLRRDDIGFRIILLPLSISSNIDKIHQRVFLRPDISLKRPYRKNNY